MLVLDQRPAPSATEDLDVARCRAENYALVEVRAPHEAATYDALLQTTYRPLKFLTDKVYPRATATRYRLMFRGSTAGICALTPVTDPDTMALYGDLVPPLETGRRPRLLEITNVILTPEHRGGIALGFILAQCAEKAIAHWYDYIVGITRYQTLRYFVDYGVVPVDHPPLHLLGKKELRDFAIYYDTHSEESVRYLRERTRIYFHQVAVLAQIKRRCLDD